MNDPITLAPIGVVHCSVATRDAMPVEGVTAEVAVFAPYTDALDHLEQSSHIIVLAFLHCADRGVLRARPRKLDPHAPEWGVFATRSPDRVNPLAMTVVPLTRREGQSLWVEHLDLIDQTPVVDLKSYCPGWDAVFCAARQRRTPQTRLDDHRLLVFLRRDLENHLGADARSSEARLALAALFVVVRELGVDPRDPKLRIRLSRCDATVDALMGMTGACFANGRLEVGLAAGPHRFAFEAGGRAIELRERQGVTELLDRPQDFGSGVFEVVRRG